MKVSKLDYERLSDEEKYLIVMSKIIDFSHVTPKQDEKADVIVVLGCSPIPLRARTLKMMELVRNGYGQNVLLSGGKGWQNLFRKKNKETGEITINEPKRQELLAAISKTISADLLGDNPTPKRLELHERFIQGMRELGQTEHVMSYEQRQEIKKCDMTEVQFMQLIILSNGGLKGAKMLHEPFSTTTKQNMEYTTRLLEILTRGNEGSPVRRMIIVTSSFHCRRSYLTFKKQFPNIEVVVCPSTLDLTDRGLSIDRMLESDYYRTQIARECDAIINYSRNGSIADVELSDLVGEEVARRIERRQQVMEF